MTHPTNKPLTNSDRRETPEQILKGLQLRTTTFHMTHGKSTVLTDRQIAEALAALDRYYLTQQDAIVNAVIGEKIKHYQPYLVVRHKLGLKENQEQAKIITACINGHIAEQHTTYNKLRGGRDE